MAAAYRLLALRDGLTVPDRPCALAELRYDQRIRTTSAIRQATPRIRRGSIGWSGTPKRPQWSIRSEHANWPAMNSITVVAAPSRGVAESATSTTKAPMIPPVQAQGGCAPNSPHVRQRQPQQQRRGQHGDRAHQDREHRSIDRVPSRPCHTRVQERLHCEQAPTTTTAAPISQNMQPPSGTPMQTR